MGIHMGGCLLATCAGQSQPTMKTPSQVPSQTGLPVIRGMVAKTANKSYIYIIYANNIGSDKPQPNPQAVHTLTSNYLGTHHILSQTFQPGPPAAAAPAECEVPAAAENRRGLKTALGRPQLSTAPQDKDRYSGDEHSPGFGAKQLFSILRIPDSGQ